MADLVPFPLKAGRKPKGRGFAGICNVAASSPKRFTIRRRSFLSGTGASAVKMTQTTSGTVKSQPRPRRGSSSSLNVKVKNVFLQDCLLHDSRIFAFLLFHFLF